MGAVVGEADAAGVECHGVAADRAAGAAANAAGAGREQAVIGFGGTGDGGGGCEALGVDGLIGQRCNDRLAAQHVVAGLCGHNGADAIAGVGAAEGTQRRTAAGTDGARGTGMGAVVGEAHAAGVECHAVAADRATGAAANAAGAGREQAVVGLGRRRDARRRRQRGGVDGAGRADARLPGQNIVAGVGDHPVAGVAATFVAAARAGERAQRHVAAGHDGLVGGGDVGVAEGQAHAAGVKRNAVGAHPTAGTAADARAGGRQQPVVGLGGGGDRRRRREASGVDGHRRSAAAQRRYLVIAGETPGSVRKRDGGDVLARRGDVGVAGCGAGVGQRLAVDVGTHSDRAAQAGGAVVGLGSREGDGPGADGGRHIQAVGVERIVGGGTAVRAGDAGDRQAGHRYFAGADHVGVVVAAACAGEARRRIVAGESGDVVGRREAGRRRSAGVVDLADAAVGEARRQRPGGDGYRRSAAAKRRQLVIGGQAAGSICKRDGVDVLARRGDVGVAGRGARVGQRFTADAGAHTDITRQAGAAVIHLGSREGDGLGADRARRRGGVGDGVVAAHVAAAAIDQGVAGLDAQRAGVATEDVGRSKFLGHAGRVVSRQQPGHRDRACRTRRTVVGFAGAHRSERQRQRRDDAGRIGDVADVVVAGHVGAGAILERDGRGRHRLAGTGHLAVEAQRRGRIHAVANDQADDVRRAAGAAGAVVVFGHRRRGHG